MADQKGSLKNRLLVNKIIKTNLKRKKILESELEEQKRKKEYQRLKDIINYKPVLGVIVVNPKQVINVIDSLDYKADDTIKPLEQALLINEKTAIIVDENKKEGTTIVTEKQIKELDQTINQEIEETKKEDTIVQKADIIIEQAKKDIIEVKEEIKKLETPIKEEFDSESLKNKEDKFKKIKEKIERLKKIYEVLKSNLDFSDYEYINDEILLDEISNYKFIVDSNDKVESLARECKKEVKKLEMIVTVCEQKTNLGKVIKAKREKIKERDNKFGEYKKDVEEKTKVTDKLEKTISEFQDHLDQIDKKIYSINTDYPIKEIKKFSFGIDNLLQITLLMTGLKRKKLGFIFGSLLMMNFSKSIKAPKTNPNNISIYNNLLSIEYDINQTFNKMDQFQSIINITIKDIEGLLDYFNGNFKDYIELIPEYKNILNKINLIIETLKSKNKELDQTKDSLETQNEKNKIKIKKIEGLL